MPTIYLADRNADFRAALAHELSKGGLEVVEFTSGSELYASLFGGFPDLVLMATDLDEIDGFEVFSLVARRHPGQSLPIVFLSTFVHPHVVDVCLRRGAWGYVDKRLAVERLVYEVSGVLQRRASSRRPSDDASRGAVVSRDCTGERGRSQVPSSDGDQGPPAGSGKPDFERVRGWFTKRLQAAQAALNGRVTRQWASRRSVLAAAGVGAAILGLLHAGARRSGDASIDADRPTSASTAAAARREPDKREVDRSGNSGPGRTAPSAVREYASLLAETAAGEWRTWRMAGRDGALRADDATQSVTRSLTALGVAVPPGAVLDRANSDPAARFARAIAGGGAGRLTVTFRSRAGVREVVKFYSGRGVPLNQRIVPMGGRFQGVRRAVARGTSKLRDSREATITVSRPGVDLRSRRLVAETTIRIVVL